MNTNAGDHDYPMSEEPAENEQEDIELVEGAEQVFEIGRDPQMRLDVYLQQRLKGVSRSRVQKLIDRGDIDVNGKPGKSSHVVRRGDQLIVRLPSPSVHTIEPEEIPLDILYEDDHCIVLNKQAGVIVHPAKGNGTGTLLNALAWHFKQQIEQHGGEWQEWRTVGFAPAPASGSRKEREARKKNLVTGLSTVGSHDMRPGVIHRLDRDTTGCIVFAKSDFAHWRIAKQFERRQTTKAYLAIVHGNFDAPGEVIELPIGKHPTIHEAFCVRHDHLGKPSVTILRVREQYKGYSLVELELKTGRTHQIRVHLSYLGHPIVGDVLYGGEPIGQPELDNPPLPAAHRRYLNYARLKQEAQKIHAQTQQRDDILLAQPMLHAAFLKFFHPALEEDLLFTAPMHSPMREVLALLRERRIEAVVAEEGTWVDTDALLK